MSSDFERLLLRQADIIEQQSELLQEMAYELAQYRAIENEERRITELQTEAQQKGGSA